jgi:phage-related tail protein
MVSYTYDEGTDTGGAVANTSPLPGLGGASALGLGGLAAEGAGLGLGLFGAFGQANASKTESNLSMNKAALEMQQNQVRWNQAQMGIRRSNLQALRNDQQSRSIAMTNAVAGTGTLGSSEYGGALGQIAGETGNTLSNLSEAYISGQQQYNINNQISGNEMQMAQEERKKSNASLFSSIGSGLTSLGGSLLTASTGGGGAGALASLLPLLAL